jgi:hypothetical protein
MRGNFGNFLQAIREIALRLIATTTRMENE